MFLKAMAVGPIQANCFIVGCEETRQALVIDPGAEGDRILMALADARLKATHIVNTHGHFDHVGANRRVKEVTGAELLIHRLDAPMLIHLPAQAAAFGLATEESPAPDRLLEDGETVAVGRLSFMVIHTPGHTPGGISLHGDGVLFVGDTLFAGSVGRTDFPGGDFATLKHSSQKRLFLLSERLRVCTGHGPDTTIGAEKRFNPFVAMH